jgi:hypothetical protein
MCLLKLIVTVTGYGIPIVAATATAANMIATLYGDRIQ